MVPASPGSIGRFSKGKALGKRKMRKTKLFEVAASGTADGAILATLKSVGGYERFCLETVAGSIRVLPSLDGENYNLPQLALSQEPGITTDTPDAQTGTIVGKTTANVPAYFTGDFRGLRLIQVGATPAAFRLLAGAKE